MTSHRAKFQEDTKYRYVQFMEYNPNMFLRAMVKASGLSFDRIIYCMKVQIVKSLVKIHNFSQNQNKFGFFYLLTHSSIFEKTVLTRTLLKHKLQKYEPLKTEIKALKFETETENYRSRAIYERPNRLI
jgi:hypothetical protein